VLRFVPHAAQHLLRLVRSSLHPGRKQRLCVGIPLRRPALRIIPRHISRPPPSHRLLVTSVRPLGPVPLTSWGKITLMMPEVKPSWSRETKGQRQVVRHMGTVTLTKRPIQCNPTPSMGGPSPSLLRNMCTDPTLPPNTTTNLHRPIKLTHSPRTLSISSSPMPGRSSNRSKVFRHTMRRLLWSPLPNPQVTRATSKTVGPPTECNGRSRSVLTLIRSWYFLLILPLPWTTVHFFCRICCIVRPVTLLYLATFLSPSITCMH
jgi:hypothetical protein